MIRNILALLGLLAVALATAVTVNARDWGSNDDRPPSLRVSFADLNLSTPEGQRALDRRIGGAINSICGHVYGVELWMRSDVEQCRRKARRSTETQVARAIDRARTGGVALANAPVSQPIGGGSQ